MASFLLTILCLNLDALSYGISYGVIKTHIKFKYLIFITCLSTLFFAIPLFVSKYIYEYFNPLTLRFINAGILFLLGIIYIIKNSKNTPTKKQVKLSFKTCFFECIAISIDAIFTAILSGFSGNFFIFSVFFYGLTNYFAIFLGNRFSLIIQNKLRFNLGFFSGFIFIFLGFMKCIGI